MGRDALDGQLSGLANVGELGLGEFTHVTSLVKLNESSPQQLDGS